ncbi:MAG: hypothetical protein WCJ33_08295, partial [Pseudomonadota bacterium]
NITIYCTPNYIKLENSSEFFIKKSNGLQFNLITTYEGSRLFVSKSTTIDFEVQTNVATILAILYSIAMGLSRGYHTRLRLAGIGFRAIIRDIPTTTELRHTPIYTKNYIYKRMQSHQYSDKSNNKLLVLKIGYSHESIYPIAITKGTSIKVSRLESRSKSTLLNLKSNNKYQLNQIAMEIREFRIPDVYKGKGIYHDREVIKLKKGKRQG